MKFEISSQYHGTLLRSYLKSTLGISTAALAKLKNHPHGIVVNGKRVTVRYVLQAGDLLELASHDTPENASQNVVPTELPLDVLYEDDHVIAMNKPPDMPTHPSHGHLTDTLANALAWRYQREGRPFVFRPLGRLDRNTSGVVIAGKHKAASGALGRALLSHQVQKKYLAILQGQLSEEKLALCTKENTTIGETVYTLRTHVYRPEGQGIRREVCSPDTERCEVAVTQFCILGISHDEQLTLVLAQPVTGRTHQLRLHFSYLGASILGDDIYGEASPLIPRHALHALSISLPCPFANVDMATPPTFSSLLPPAPARNKVDKNGILHTLAPIPPDMDTLLRTHFQSLINELIITP